MSTKSHVPPFVWRWMRPFNQRLSRIYADKFKARELVLLLTTTGRKSGLPRVTPLQYELEGGVYYVGSARGMQADWARNLAVDPRVEVQAGDKRFRAIAEPITDPGRIADFLELRLRRRPKMMRLMLRLEGLPAGFSRGDLEGLAGRITLVALYPCEDTTDIPSNA